METWEARTAPGLLRRLTVPVGLAVVAVTAVAWYVTWSTSDVTMMLTNPSMPATDPAAIAAFLALLVVMMVAMMLPSALPMILAYRGLTRLEAGRPVKPADDVATALFVLPYFLVWGAFGALALLGLLGVGLLGPLRGALALAPAVVLLAAGAFQFTRTKEVCLGYCESPMGFVVRFWRSGRLGALRMGSRHAMYCIGCCWLFMVVLFVVGSMSLPWMGLVSVLIFAEKVGSDRFPVSRAIAVLLFVLAGLVGLRALLPR